MSTRTYPFTAYVLTPEMHVTKVELMRKYDWRRGYHETAGGKLYHDSELHGTPQAAIAVGRAKLDNHRSKLQVQQANIEKRAANLDKAAAKL